MAVLTVSATSISPTMSTPHSKPESFSVCKNHFAATTIQAAARMYLAKKKWEGMYVKHIQREVVRLKDELKEKAKKEKKREFLDKHAAIIQALARGYIVRGEYRESDRLLRGVGHGAGLSLMESVRKRMNIRQRIESLKQQISEVQAAKSSYTSSDSDCDSENNDDASVLKVERLKGKQHKLQIKAKTLEAVTRPLQEKFKGLCVEHEKLRKKYGNIESKNESRKYANETSSELLEEKIQAIVDTGKELDTVLSSDGMEYVSQQRSKAQQRLDTLVETSSEYARLGMSERDAAAFADEVARIGKEAHRKAKLFRDSLRSHMSSNLSKTWSSRSLTSNTDGKSAFDSTAAVAPATIAKNESNSSLLRDGVPRSTVPKRGHGRVLRNLLRDRNQNRSLSPTLQRQDGSFNSLGSANEDAPKFMLKGQRFFVKRDIRERGCRSLSEQDPRNRSLSRTPSPHGRESVFIKRDRSSRSLSQTPSPQRRESVFVKRDRSRRNHLESSDSRNRTPSPQRRESAYSVSPTQPRSDGSFNKTPVISNKVKVGSSTTVTPKISNKMKIGSSTSPKINNTPKVSYTETPKMSNKQTPKHSNVTNDSSTKPVRRTYSETNKTISKLQRRLPKALSERLILQPSKALSPSSRLNKLKEELREECGTKIPQKEGKDESSKERRKSRDRSEAMLKKSPKGNKKKDRDRAARKKLGRSRSRSNSRSRSVHEDSSKNVSETGGLLRGRRPSNVKKEEHEQDLQDQPSRIVSLAAPTIDVRKKKNTYLRRTKSLTESARNRRKLVDECIDSRGMLPNLE